MRLLDVRQRVVAGELQHVPVALGRLVEPVVQLLQLAQRLGGQHHREHLPGSLGELDAVPAGTSGGDPIAPEQAGIRGRPGGGEAEGQVVGAKALLGATSLGGHLCEVVAGERQRGPGAGYLPDQVAYLLVEADALQRALGRLQLLLDPRGLPGHQRQRGRAHQQPGSGLEHRSRKRGQPVQDGQQHAAQVQVHAVAVDEALGALHVAGRRRVMKGLQEPAVAFMPLTGADVQVGDLLRRQALPQPSSQQVAEEVVIAIPAPLVVEGDDEQVGALDGLQGLVTGAGRGAQDRIAQGAAQAVEDGGAQQERPDSAGCRSRTSSSR